MEPAISRRSGERAAVVTPEIELKARLQGGVISAAQLGTFGWNQRIIRTRVAQFVLHDLGGDVYSLGHRGISANGWHWAAALSAGPHGVLSYATAAFLWGLIDREPAELHASSQRSDRAGCDGSVIHRPQRLGPDDRTTRNGLPVTTILRTLLDLAPTTEPAELRRMIEAAALKHDLAPLRVAAYARTFPKRRPGAGKLAAAAHEVVGAVVLRSNLERMFRSICEEAGLPPYRANVPFEQWELDAYWDRWQVAVELDWFTTHSARINYRRDRQKGLALARRGIELLRIAGEDMEADADAVVDTVRAVLHRRGATP